MHNNTSSRPMWTFQTVNIGYRLRIMSHYQIVVQVEYFKNKSVQLHKSIMDDKITLMIDIQQKNVCQVTARIC